MTISEEFLSEIERGAEMETGQTRRGSDAGKEWPMSKLTPETLTKDIVRDVWVRAGWGASRHWTGLANLFLNTGNGQAAIELCDEINKLRAEHRSSTQSGAR